MEYQWISDYPEPTGKTHGDTVISLMLAASQLDKIGREEPFKMWVKGWRVI